jgi:hypothetical protein
MLKLNKNSARRHSGTTSGTNKMRTQFSGGMRFVDQKLKETGSYQFGVTFEASL